MCSSDLLASVCESLARQIARDGEGAETLIEVTVDGAATPEQARRVAKAIVNSPLVKTAVHGADPNWGRIVSAAGYAGIPFNPAGVDLWVNGLHLYERGAPLAFDHVAASPAPSIVLMDFNDGGCRYAVRYLLTDLAVDDPTDSSVRARIYFALKRMQIPLSFSTYNVQLHLANKRASEQQDREFERRLVMLRQLDLFRELAPDEQHHIASVLRYAPFGAGEVMTKQGNVAHWLYVISAGEVSVQVSVDGHDREVSRLHGPAFVGEMGLLTGEPRAATIVAVTDVECYRLDKTAFQHVLDERPELARRISELLTQRRVELEVVREDLSAEAKAQRIAESQTEILAQIKDFFGLGR